MADRDQLAFVKNALGVLGVPDTTQLEPAALVSELFRRLLAGNLTVAANGTISATVTTTPDVSTATGTLPVAHGGTGAVSLTAHGVVVGEGTAAVAVTAAGTAGQPLLSGGASADPAYGTLGVPGGGTGATTLTGLVKGNGTSVMTAVTAPAGAVVGDTDTQTLTNKRVTKRVTTIVSSATPTINTDDCDVVNITALAAAITSMTTNLSGTPVIGDRLLIQLKDDGTGRAITWGTSFLPKGVALPTTTVAGKLLTVGFISYDGTHWGCVAAVTEA